MAIVLRAGGPGAGRLDVDVDIASLERPAITTLTLCRSLPVSGAARRPGRLARQP